jgi:hypothetical protein
VPITSGPLKQGQYQFGFLPADFDSLGRGFETAAVRAKQFILDWLSYLQIQ